MVYIVNCEGLFYEPFSPLLSRASQKERDREWCLMKDRRYIHTYSMYKFHIMLIGHLSPQEWKPRWGYKRINDPKDKWMIEIPDKAGGGED